MPRHKSRFSDLEKQYRQSGGTAAAGSVLANYINFKTGKTKVARRKAALTTAQKQRYGVSVLPFNLDGPASPAQTDRYETSITAYSNSGRVNLSLSNAECGYGAVTATGVTAKTDSAFYAALIKPFVRTATAAATPKSAITGVEYKYWAGNSYAIPFGRRTASAAGDSEEERRVALAAEAKGSTGSEKASAVGYDPEVFRGSKPSLAELPGA